jgi:sodium transport system permease protein
VNLAHIFHVFKKDSLEIIRDRRTLFVNIILPALLYPFIALFMLQVIQLTKGQKSDPARIAIIDLPERAAELIQQKTSPLPSDMSATHADAQPSPIDVTIAILPNSTVIELRTAALALASNEDAEKAALRGDLAAEIAQQRTALLRLLRQHQLVGLLINRPHLETAQQFCFVAYDNAHVKGERVKRILEARLEHYAQEKIAERLANAGLDAQALKPINLTVRGLAPIAETVRTHFAGMIPLILVIFAALGAFYPAIDLIAGERERGTLESLLSWPVARRDLFIGKLLVTCAAALISVILNLGSLALTMGLVGHQLAAAGADLSDMMRTGIGTLIVCLGVLLPLTLTLGALSLALAGLAASAKEAQNYLSPLLLVVMVAAMVAAIPDTQPNFILDLIPITGSVLALKESLQGHTLPWLHLALSTGASIALATVVVAWATRLLEDERFCYPGLVRAGWGRFRIFGKPPSVPNGLEVMAVFGFVVGGMTFGSGLFHNAPSVVVVAAPLLCFVLLPTLLHTWLGNYQPQLLLGVQRPPVMGVLHSIVAVPFAIMLSVAIGQLQPQPPNQDFSALEKIITGLRDNGLAVTLLCIAVVPAVCEELFCRGTLLNGLQRSIGTTGAVLISSFLFASLHLSPYRFLPQMTLGIFLAVLALRYRSIWPCVILHAGHNGGALMIGEWKFDTVITAFSTTTTATMGLVGFFGLLLTLLIPNKKPQDL